MPVVGVVCDYDGSYQSFQTCIDCHQSRGKEKRNCHFPTFSLKMGRDNGINRKGAGYSATTILSCPRAVALLERYDYYEPLEGLWNKTRGELMHSLAESEPDMPEGIIKEERIYKEVYVHGDTIRVTGKADYIDEPYQLILDYKFVGEIPETFKNDHIAQFNIYAWLCDGGRFLGSGEVLAVTIERGGMYYLTLKKKKKRDGTIIKPWRKVSYPVWKSEKTEQLVIDRLTPIVNYHTTGRLPACWPYERGFWECDCTKIENQLTERGIRVEEQHEV